MTILSLLSVNVTRENWAITHNYISFFFLIFRRSLLKLRCETVTEIVLCCCHQVYCLLYHLGEINSGITSHVPVYLWTFTLLLSNGVVVSDLNKNFSGSTDLAWISGFAYPYSPPPTPVLHGAAKSHCFTVGCIPENTELYALLSLAVSPWFSLLNYMLKIWYYSQILVCK